jgi:hypothetical protein
VRLTLTTNPSINATGTMSMKDGGKSIKSAQLIASDQNTVIMLLPQLSIGYHSLQGTFSGSPTAMNASTGVVQVKVVR